MKNLELQKQESRELLTGEQRFIQAKSDVKIKDATDDQIKEAIRLVMVKIGLRAANFPDKMEKMVLLTHIIQSFPENTVDEIRLAWDWAIDERLEIDFNCYENFSCAYFSKIMKAYNSLAGMVKTDKPVLMIETPEEPVDEEKYKEFLKSDFAQRLRSKGVNPPE